MKNKRKGISLDRRGCELKLKGRTEMIFPQARLLENRNNIDYKVKMAV